MANMITPNDYIRVSVALFENPKLADLADDHGAKVYAVWIHLLITAKRARHFGRVIIKPVRVARLVGIEVSKAAAIIEGLVERRALTAVDDDREHHYQIRNWSKWQSLTNAEHSKNWRAARNGSPHAGSKSVSDDSDSSVTDRAQDETTQDETKPDETSMGADTPDSTTDPTTDLRIADIKTVFEYWKRNAAPIQLAEPDRAKLKPRREHINARLDEGYSVGELCECIDGYAADPWFRGEDPKNQRPFLEIENIMRNGKKVEAGVTKHRRGVHGSIAIGSEKGRPSRVRPQ